VSDATEARGWRLPDGRFHGHRITRVPLSHLKYMVTTGNPNADRALAEMKARGTITPCLDVTGHAVDRASQKLLKLWRHDRDGSEGLHSWLARVAQEALEKKPPAGAPERRHHKGIRFIFKFEFGWPVLQSVAKLNRTPPRRPSPRRA
jgi:hypothetical protein